jgi:hypothetical protein
MVNENKLQHVSTRFFYFLGIRQDGHAISHVCVARDLELWHPLDFYQTHPAVTGNREVGVVAKPGDIDPYPVADVDQPLAIRDIVALTVYNNAGHATSFMRTRPTPLKLPSWA